MIDLEKLRADLARLEKESIPKIDAIFQELAQISIAASEKLNNSLDTPEAKMAAAMLIASVERLVAPMEKALISKDCPRTNPEKNR